MLLSLFDGGFLDQASALLDVVALAAIFASVTVYNRTKSALAASESAGKAWHEEKEAAVARADRVLADRQELVVKLSVLEARPNLSKLEDMVTEFSRAMGNHEVKAAERTDKLIEAIGKLNERRT